MKQDNNSVEFKNIAPGLYDDTMQCVVCGFCYEDRADSSFSENTINSTHECKGLKDE